jgi:hypothetical protein
MLFIIMLELHLSIHDKAVVIPYARFLFSPPPLGVLIDSWAAQTADGRARARAKTLQLF